jgi:hypothetical protein
MANRPCKPDDDLKKLWRALMPGVALPACGTGEDAARQAPPRYEAEPLPPAKNES